MRTGVHFSQLAGDALGVTCDRCGRQGRYRLARLIETRGDMRLTDFLTSITRDCPRAVAAGLYDRCRARFVFEA